MERTWPEQYCGGCGGPNACHVTVCTECGEPLDGLVVPPGTGTLVLSRSGATAFDGAREGAPEGARREDPTSPARDAALRRSIHAHADLLRRGLLLIGVCGVVAVLVFGGQKGPATAPAPSVSTPSPQPPPPSTADPDALAGATRSDQERAPATSSLPPATTPPSTLAAGNPVAVTTTSTAPATTTTTATPPTTTTTAPTTTSTSPPG